MLNPISTLGSHFIRLLDDKPKKASVLVVGYGWAGREFVNTIDNKKYNVKVISEQTARLNQPRLISSFKAIYTQAPKHTNIIQDEVVQLNETGKQLIGRKNNYKYDYLVIATGSEVNDFGTPGVSQHCLMFKTERDLEILKNKLTVKQDITVVGAGPTGIELALKLKYLGHNVRIIEASSEILPGFSDNMRKKALSIIKRDEIDLVTNHKILSMDTNNFITTGGTVKRDGIAIWTCGVRPTSFVTQMTGGGAFRTDDHLRVKPNIYAIGDIVYGRGPPTAQNAKQQGHYLGLLFNSDFKPSDKYIYKEKGRILDITSGLLIEFNGFVFTLPYVFRSLLYIFLE